MCKSHGTYFMILQLISSSYTRRSVPNGEENLRKPLLLFWNCRNVQAENNKSMEQYYIATEDGKTEGPYPFETLKILYTHGKITGDVLVCVAGGQEWVEFKTVLGKERKEESKKSSLGRLMNQYDPVPEDQHEKNTHEYSEPLEITVEGLFRIAGILVLLAGVIVFLNHAEEQTGIGLAYLIAGAFSCLVCFWCAKVIKLLSHIVDFLNVISTRIYNVKNKD